MYHARSLVTKFSSRVKLRDSQDIAKSNAHPLVVDNIGFEGLASSFSLDKAHLIEVLKKGVSVIRIGKKGKMSSLNLFVQYPFTHIKYGRKLILLSDVEEVRRGMKSREFDTAKSTAYAAEMCLSLIWAKGEQTLNVVFPSAQMFDIWWRGFIDMINAAKNADDEDNYLARKWEKVTGGRNEIDEKKLQLLLKKLNLRAPIKEVKQRLMEVDENNNGKLDYEEMCILFNKLRERGEIREIFDAYKMGGVVTPRDLSRFMRTEQGEDLDDAACEGIMRHFLALHDPQYQEADAPKLSLAQFESFLTTDINHVSRSSSLGVHMDMTMPLTHYFIASSHNTYLQAGQLKGLSSVEQYRTVFKLGCRCVELDIWDGEDGEPIITHGHTLTSKIPFHSVVQCVKDYAFVGSEYPVILSLENHCSRPQQAKMAQYFKDILGDMLATHSQQKGCMAALPSPYELRGKVLLKGKTIGTASEEAAFELERAEEEGGKADQTASNKISPELSELIYLRAVPFMGSLEAVQESSAPWEMCSFSELKAAKLQQKAALPYIHYNHNHFSRIYPKGTRIDSSNYNPMPHWTAGCQIVALNYQTEAEPTWINHALFASNGGCGYVPKPLSLLPGAPADPNAGEDPTSKYKRMRVRVYSALQLPCKAKGRKGDKVDEAEILDPFVVLEIHGVAADTISAQTKVVKNNGFNPTWNEEFEFSFKSSSLAVLLLRVVDYEKVGGNDRVGWFAVRVEDIMPGYRYVPLYSPVDNKRIPMCNLFCKFHLD